MGLSTDLLDGSDLSKKYEELCEKLDVDGKVRQDAWKNFKATGINFTLEGDPLQWLCCAIYESSWESSNPIANHINFTQLLKHFNISLAQFFSNIRHWCDMRTPPHEFVKKVDYLEMSFTVSYNVFKDYQPLFLRIFKAPEVADLDAPRLKNRRQKHIPCNTLKVFEFCWTLFITIKGEASYSNELVTLFHLLITICDWAFKNALLADKRDLLNPDFEGLPADWNSPDYKNDQAPCIIALLCPTETMVTEVKYIKEYQFKHSLNNLFNQSILTGGNDEYSDIFDALLFERNYKNITAAYEKHFNANGDFDERIFLAEYRRKLLETEENAMQAQSNPATGESSKDMVIAQECLTPLTGRKYLGPRESNQSPFVAATESVARLITLLHGRTAEPSPVLKELFESCTNNPSEKISAILTRLGQQFVAAYPVEKSEVANKRLHLATTLFFKLLENILQNEKHIHNDISNIVDKDVFYECMFACCLEIVIYSYKSMDKFPWILDVLQIAPYNFIKVIELIIRSKDKFARDTIKHLNMIEEMILSSLVWKSDSLIWEAIRLSEKEVPKFEETALPSHLQNDQRSSEDSALRNILTSETRHLQSPGPSAIDRFQSPITHTGGATHLMIKDHTGVRMIPILSSSESPKVSAPSQPTTPRKVEAASPAKPRRTGGLSILFRKFYNLSGERMEHLCTHLKITNTEMKRKIWTAFEELVRKNGCELMKDRDLDQLLMCAVYLICKLTNTTKTFFEIIKSYKSQPQAVGDIYRNVLISKSNTDNGGTFEDRKDLIEFYNTVVIKAMNRFASKVINKSTQPEGDILLSPLPSSRGHVVQVFDNIFVKPLDAPLDMSPNVRIGKVYNYVFSRSPSKDLKDINRAIEGGKSANKRILSESDLRIPSAKRIANRKVQSLIEERRNQNTE